MLYEGAIVPTALYGAEAWGMRSAERRKVNVLEMKCLRSLVGVWRMDRVRRTGTREWRTATRETEVRLDGWCEGGLMPGTHYVNAHLYTSLRLSVKKKAIQPSLAHYKASTMSTNIQNSFNSSMHKKPLILLKWIQITYIIAFNSHNSLQYSKVLLN